MHASIQDFFAIMTLCSLSGCASPSDDENTPGQGDATAVDDADDGGSPMPNDSGAPTSTSSAEDSSAGGSSGGTGTEVSGSETGPAGTAETSGSDSGSETSGSAVDCDPGSATETALVQIPRPGGGTYGIDATEVTNAQYCLWLRSAADPSDGRPSACSWNDDFVPLDWPYDEAEANHPVNYVDWCDAYAYCTGVGKRLCGAIEGGANEFADAENAETSQWYRACSQGGQNDYPYGPSYTPQTCNDTSQGGGIVEVATLEGCQASGAYAGVYDLNGNVNEWEDSCMTIGDQAELDNCYVRGGSFAAQSTGNRCSWAAIEDRDTRTIDVGFRCCEAG